MEHKLPPLPFTSHALEPFISTEAIEYHHDKHHAAYVNKLNELIKGTKYENMSLEEIVLGSDGPLFDNAAQAWNHSFFWNCLKPQAGGDPNGKVSELINKKWGSFDKFKDEFTESALANFGSGWTWLIMNKKGELGIMNTSDAQTPKTLGLHALMTLDVWEHAYYIDYRNKRADFVRAFWHLVNWDFVNNNI